MSSLQNRLFTFMLRNRHLFSFHLKRSGWDENTSVSGFRRRCEQGASRFGKIPEGIEITPLTVKGMRTEWILPSPGKKDRVILYVHGGGFIAGSCADHRVHAARLVKESGIGALLFEYRLAPENPYPAGLDDALAVYRWLLNEGFLPSRVILAGDSAGGNICLAMLLALRDRGEPLPAAAVVLSPLTDFLFTGQSHRTRAGVCLSPPGMNAVCAGYYAGDNDPALPYLSPLYGELHGLPPLLIYAGDYETLRDDAVRFAEKAKAAGVDVTLKVGKEMVHCYPLLPAFIPEARRALVEIGAYIKERLGEKEVEYPGRQ